MKYIQPLINLFRFHKMKIFVFIAATVIFFLALFPYNDLGELVTAKVSEATNKQIYLQFDEMGFSVLPQIGLQLKNVYVESAAAPTLTMGALSLSPSLRSLLTFSPGFSLYAQDFLKGDLQFSLRAGKKNSKGDAEQIAQLDLEGIGLDEISRIANLPVSLAGSVQGDTEINVDPNFLTQPSGPINLEISQFSPPASIPTPFGAFNLPSLTISRITAEARLVGGELFLDNVKIGSGSDELSGTVKGRLRMRLSRRGVQITPVFSAYEFDVRLQAKPSFVQKASTLLSFLDAYKTPGIGATAYNMKLKGNNFRGVPKITALK